MNSVYTNRSFGLLCLLACLLTVLPAAGRASSGTSAFSTTAYLPQTVANYTTPNGTLSDGGVFREPGGAMLGAVPGTLTSQLAVTLLPTSAPAMPHNAGTTLGNYYRVAATSQLRVPAGKPLLLGLPVPAGASTSQLAMALLLPPGAVLGADASAPQWVMSKGRYDAASNMHVVTLFDIDPDGLTAVLVSSPAYQAATTPTRQRAQTTLPHTYESNCANFGRSCTTQNKTWLVTELEQAYADFVTNLKFNEPALGHWTGYFLFRNGIWNPQLESQTKYDEIWIKDGPCGDEAGEYVPKSQAIYICLDPVKAPGAYEQRIVRHELFHAIQFAYPAVYAAWDSKSEEIQWLTEGTAAAAEQSSATMRRSPDFGRHPVTVPLTDPDYRYLTHDFWVYTGLNPAQSLAYLQPVFTAGGTADQVYSALNLSQNYWKWAKNQAIEKTERAIDHDSDASDGFVNAVCMIEDDLIGTPLALNHPDVWQLNGTLEPLSAVVVAVTFERAFGGLLLTADAGADTAELRYKVYEEGEANCAGVADGQRGITFRDGPTQRFVLLANVSATKPINFVVRVVGG